MTTLSLSSKRKESGLSNSLLACGSNGLRDHRERPGALTGTAQVIASFLRSGATGWTLPTQISLAKTAPVASSFMPADRHPGIVLVD